MPRKQRLVLLGLALAVAVAAVVVLGTGGDEEPRRTTTTTTAAPGATTGGSTQSRPEAKPAPPPVDRVDVRGGRVEGGLARLSYEQGEQVRIDVRSDQPDEIHVHGYDIQRPVAPGEPAKLRFRARLEGVFEIELHDAGRPIAQLRVEP